MSGRPGGKTGEKRTYRKYKKISTLPSFSLPSIHGRAMGSFLNTKLVVNGNSTGEIPLCLRNRPDVSILPILGFKCTIDSKHGARVKMDDGEFLFASVPRKEVCDLKRGAISPANLMEAVYEKGKPASRSSQHKEVFFESGNKYVVIGLRPFQGKKGISNSTIVHMKGDLGEDLYAAFENELKRIERLGFGYVDASLLRGMKRAKEVCGHHTITELYAAVAFTQKAFLQVHVDDDSGLCMVTIMGGTDKKDYFMDDPIQAYFAFPTEGIAVAMRPGDILIFNPRVPHAVSSAAQSAGTYYCMSLYLKSKNVGGNDADKSLTAEQKYWAKGLPSQS